MQVFGTMVRRELGGFFLSMSGYAVMAGAVLQIGLSFVVLLHHFNGDSSPMPVTELFYSTQFFWFILLLTAPIITMRLFALEKASGTFETLATTPAGDAEIVLAKFFGAFFFYLVMWLPLLACVFIVREHTTGAGAAEYGDVAGTFAGIALIGALFISVGCFTSALTSSQVTAAITCFAVELGLFLLSYLSDGMDGSDGRLGRLCRYVSSHAHMEDFCRGVVDTRCVVYYLTGTLFFLFLTHRVIESRRWR